METVLMLKWYPYDVYKLKKEIIQYKLQVVPHALARFGAADIDIDYSGQTLGNPSFAA